MRRVNLSIIFIFFLQFLAIDVFSTDGEVNHSPYDVVYNHIHFLKKGSYDELQSAASFDIPNKKNRIDAAITLKEILDAKIDPSALLNKIPDDPSFTDSTSKRHIYVLYDKLPQVYVELKGNKWYYSQATVDALPQLHRKIFPFGTNIWAKWFPIKNNNEFLRLYTWQWIGIGIILLAFILCFTLLKYLLDLFFTRFYLRNTSMKLMI